MKPRVYWKRAFGLASLVCAVMFTSVSSAKAYRSPLPRVNLAMGDQHELGRVLPGTSAGNSEIAQYINFMVGLSPGESDRLIINGQDNLVTRSTNNFGTLSSPATVALRGSSMTINLGTQGTYDYLLVNYGTPHGSSEVWYVGDLSGTIIIDANLGQYGISSWALFVPAPQSVPDGGATVMLLGMALGSLGVARRHLIGR